MGTKLDNFKQSVKYRVWKMKEGTKQTAIKVGHWCRENPEAAVIASSFTIGAVSGIASGISSAAKRRRDDTSVYDPVNFMYVRVKKPLTTKQQIELDERRKRGQSVTEALKEMRLLR